jgi:polysaccharide deacetylase 2 family uncharacterized protein YibQ
MCKVRRGRILAAVLALWMAALAAGAGGSAAAAGMSSDEPEMKPITKKAAIVIDDFGNQMQGTQEMLDLPIPFTVAVMPFLPTSKGDAELAHARGKDVIIHMPMEPVKGKKSWLGPGAITVDLSDEEIRKRVEAAVDEVPHAVGMNNHMGSKVTADKRIMRIILQVCKERQLYFLDSRTTGKSVIGELAAELGVPTAANGLFFDDQYTMEHILKQAELFKKKLDKQDTLIAIGHVGPPGKKTAFALRKIIPQLDGKAEFVLVRDLIKQEQP